MTDRLLLVLLLLVVVHLLDSRADPIPEPCRNEAKSISPVWKLLCDQFLKSGNGDVTPKKKDVDGAENQVELKETVVNVKLLEDAAAQATNSVDSSRQHKAFFVDYPASQRVHQEKLARKKQQQQQKKQAVKSKKTKPESEIFFIRLPPTPYSYVPGLGYISQPPSFSTASLAGSLSAAAGAPSKQQQQQKNPFIKLPIEFVSNGKPTAVYRWPPSKQKPSKPQHHHHHHQKYKPDSPIIKLNRGPYIFDGRPKSVYLMKRNPTRPNRF